MSVWDDLINQFPYLTTIIGVAVAVATAIVLERLITRYFRRFAKSRELPPHVANGFVLIFRLLILLSAVATLLRIGGVPTEWFVTFSALGGAAVGFASTRTLGNFTAGLFVFVTRPFQVNDYVRIDNVEGVVEEITFNYTKILTPSNTLVYISNLKILDQNIVNYRYRGSGKPPLYCYYIELGFDHTLSTEELEKGFDSVIAQYVEKLPKKPEYALLRTGAFERRYMFHLYVKKPKDIFALQVSFVKDIVATWEKAKKK